MLQDTAASFEVSLAFGIDGDIVRLCHYGEMLRHHRQQVRQFNFQLIFGKLLHAQSCLENMVDSLHLRCHFILSSLNLRDFITRPFLHNLNVSFELLLDLDYHSLAL